MLEVKNLSKKYGNLKAVSKLSFSIKANQVVGFLGPNGAGKSTTMKMICGYIAPSSGEVYIDGESLLEHPLSTKRKIGYLPENAPLYGDMRVQDYLTYVCRLKGLDANFIESLVPETLELCYLNDVKHKYVAHLSKGYKQRLGIAQAIAHQPKLIILDEPTIGLDPKQVTEIRGLLKKLAKNRTILISSHILSEIQSICDNVLVLDKGLLVANKSMDDIKQESGSEAIYVLESSSGNLSLDSLKEQFPSIQDVQLDAKGFLLFFKEKPKNLNLLMGYFLEKQIEVLAIYKKDLSLEDMYLKITGDKK